MELKCLTYTSWASPGLGPQDVEAILRSSRTNNSLQGLTGLLIYNGTTFLQILEGVEPAINELLATLKKDRRHSNMSIRDDRVIGTRVFGDWAMAYLRHENGEFDGEKEVERALGRGLPESVQNMVRGLTHNFTK